MITVIEIVSIDPQHAVVVSDDVRQQDIGAFMGHAFGDVMAAMQQQGAHPTGMPFARYDMRGDGFHVEAGFPCEAEFIPNAGVHAIELPGGTAARTTYTGPYEGLGRAYQAVETWMSEEGVRPVSGPWESYLDGPEVAEPRTVITWPCVAS